MFHNPVYVTEIPISDGAYRNGKSIGQLKNNLWVVKYAGNYYIMALFKHFEGQGHNETDVDPLFFSKPA